jgi:hypothetical protein
MTKNEMTQMGEEDWPRKGTRSTKKEEKINHGWTRMNTDEQGAWKL